MKKQIMVFLLVLLVTIASALATFEVSNVKLGSDNQNRGEVVSNTFTVKNTGLLDIDEFTVKLSDVNSKYEAQITSISDTTIPVNGSIDVTVEAFVPLDLDAVDSRGKKIDIDIGNIVFEGNYSDDTPVDQKSVDLLMEAESKLEFGSSDITIDGSTKSLRDDKEYKDVKRNDEISLEIKVENNFDDDGECDDEDDYGDCDIEDIDVELEPDDSDFDDDSDSIDSIRARDDDTVTLRFDVPDDIDDGDYDFELWVTGEDENGARHGEFLTFTLEVDVPRDEVSITDFDLNPSSLDCDQKSTILTVTVENTGRNNQDEVSIFVESSRLDIKDSIYHIELDEGDRTTKSFALRLPDDVEPGQYFVQIIANVDNSDETDRDAATLIVRECRDEEEQPEEEDEDDQTDIKVIEVPPTAGVIYSSEKDEGFFNSNGYLVLLAVLFFIALLLIFILLVVLLKK